MTVSSMLMRRSRPTLALAAALVVASAPLSGGELTHVCLTACEDLCFSAGLWLGSSGTVTLPLQGEAYVSQERRRQAQPIAMSTGSVCGSGFPPLSATSSKAEAEAYLLSSPFQAACNSGGSESSTACNATCYSFLDANRVAVPDSVLQQVVGSRYACGEQATVESWVRLPLSGILPRDIQIALSGVGAALGPTGFHTYSACAMSSAAALAPPPAGDPTVMPPIAATLPFENRLCTMPASPVVCHNEGSYKTLGVVGSSACANRAGVLSDMLRSCAPDAAAGGDPAVTCEDPLASASDPELLTCSSSTQSALNFVLRWQACINLGGFFDTAGDKCSVPLEEADRGFSAVGCLSEHNYFFTFLDECETVSSLINAALVTFTEPGSYGKCPVRVDDAALCSDQIAALVALLKGCGGAGAMTADFAAVQCGGGVLPGGGAALELDCGADVTRLNHALALYREHGADADGTPVDDFGGGANLTCGSTGLVAQRDGGCDVAAAQLNELVAQFVANRHWWCYNLQCD